MRVLVVGATSGIGLYLAEHYGKIATVVALARSQERLTELRKRIGCDTIVCDLAQPDSCSAAAKVLAESEPFDLALLCAAYGPLGTSGRNTRDFADQSLLGPLASASPDFLRKALETNVTGTFTLMQAVARAMSARGGSLVMFGATASIRAKENFGIFAASKHALRGLTLAMAREQRKDGVKICHLVVDGVLAIPRLRPLWENRKPSAVIMPHAVVETVDFIHGQSVHAWTPEITITPRDSEWQ